MDFYQKFQKPYIFVLKYYREIIIGFLLLFLIYREISWYRYRNNILFELEKAKDLTILLYKQLDVEFSIIEAFKESFASIYSNPSTSTTTATSIPSTCPDINVFYSFLPDFKDIKTLTTSTLLKYKIISEALKLDLNYFSLSVIILLIFFLFFIFIEFNSIFEIFSMDLSSIEDNIEKNILKISSLNIIKLLPIFTYLYYVFLIIYSILLLFNILSFHNNIIKINKLLFYYSIINIIIYFFNNIYIMKNYLPKTLSEFKLKLSNDKTFKYYLLKNIFFGSILSSNNLSLIITNIFSLVFHFFLLYYFSYFLKNFVVVYSSNIISSYSYLFHTYFAFIILLLCYHLQESVLKVLPIYNYFKISLIMTNNANEFLKKNIIIQKLFILFELLYFNVLNRIDKEISTVLLLIVSIVNSIFYILRFLYFHLFITIETRTWYSFFLHLIIVIIHIVFNLLILFKVNILTIRYKALSEYYTELETVYTNKFNQFSKKAKLSDEDQEKFLIIHQHNLQLFFTLANDKTMQYFVYLYVADSSKESKDEDLSLQYNAVLSNFFKQYMEEFHKEMEEELKNMNETGKENVNNENNDDKETKKGAKEEDKDASSSNSSSSSSTSSNSSSSNSNDKKKYEADDIDL